MKTVIYTVFDVEPDYSKQEYIHGGTYHTPCSLIRKGQFATRFEAMRFVDEQEKGFGLTIMEVYE